MSTTARSRKRARTESPTNADDSSSVEIIDRDATNPDADRDEMQVDDASETESDASTDTHESEHRDEDLYFEDGNVILRVDNWIFRVHRSLLERESQVFRNELLPKAKWHTEGDYAGCAEVCLDEEYAGEVSGFLEAIYNAKIVFTRNFLVPAATAGFGMLRLGTVYDAPSIRQEALSRFVNSAWAIMSKCPEIDGNNDNALEIIWKPTDAIVLANIAYDHEIFRLLPLALYACCQLDGGDLVKGCQRLGYSEELYSLLMEKVLNARRLLALYAQSLIASVPRTGNPDCKNFEPPPLPYDEFGTVQAPKSGKSRCWKGASANSLPKTPPATAMVWHPVLKLNTWKKHCLQRALCSTCVAWVGSIFAAKQAGFLKDLPRVLDVHEWVEKSAKNRTDD